MAVGWLDTRQACQNAGLGSKRGSNACTIVCGRPFLLAVSQRVRAAGSCRWVLATTLNALGQSPVLYRHRAVFGRCLHSTGSPCCPDPPLPALPPGCTAPPPGCSNQPSSGPSSPLQVGRRPVVRMPPRSSYVPVRSVLEPFSRAVVLSVSWVTHSFTHFASNAGASTLPLAPSAAAARRPPPASQLRSPAPITAHRPDPAAVFDQGWLHPRDGDPDLPLSEVATEAAAVGCTGG